MSISLLEIGVFASLASFLLLSGVTVRRLITSAGPVDAQLKRLASPLVSQPSKGDGVSASLDRWLHGTLRTSGIGMSAVSIMLFTICAVAIAALAAVLSGLSIVGQLLLSISVLLIVPMALVLYKRYQLKKFAEQLPPNLDLIARAVRAGESLETAMSIAAKSSKDPIQRQFKYCVKQFEMGSSASSVMNGLATRIPTMETKIFSHTVAVHRELGGRLANGLERLAIVIRERREYIQKIHSMTSLGRYSIAAISLLGVFILIYLTLFHPDYLNKLLGSEIGLKMVGYAVISEIVGLCWIALTLKMEY